MPFNLSLRDVMPSASIDAAVERWVDRIEVAGTTVDECDIAISRHANAFSVELRVSIAGTRIRILNGASREDVYVAIGDAFRALWRTLRQRNTIGTMPIQLVHRQA